MIDLVIVFLLVVVLVKVWNPNRAEAALRVQVVRGNRWEWYPPHGWVCTGKVRPVEQAFFRRGVKEK